MAVVLDVARVSSGSSMMAVAMGQSYLTEQSLWSCRRRIHSGTWSAEVAHNVVVAAKKARSPSIGVASLGFSSCSVRNERYDVLADCRSTTAGSGIAAMTP